MKIMFLNIFLSAILCAAAGEPILSPAAQEEESVTSEGVIISNINSLNPTLLEPPPGQRCSGRNYQGRRCCTPENPCDEGEGDCDGPGDGGGHDGHTGCKEELVCGSNNCKQFGAFYHEKDDCCEKPSVTPAVPDPVPSPGPALVEPPAGQRCSGRNYQGRRCCTPENPCDEGEGDCDGPGDGGGHDGHSGCKGKLECGSNNCKKFGAFYHDKDDCCEKSSSFTSTTTPTPSTKLSTTASWGEWESWGRCSKPCGGGSWSRSRYCTGSGCVHTTQSQERYCNLHSCTHGSQSQFYDDFNETHEHAVDEKEILDFLDNYNSRERDAETQDHLREKLLQQLLSLSNDLPTQWQQDHRHYQQPLGRPFNRRRKERLFLWLKNLQLSTI